jgi:hypothetical protein
MNNTVLPTSIIQELSSVWPGSGECYCVRHFVIKTYLTSLGLLIVL